MPRSSADEQITISQKQHEHSRTVKSLYTETIDFRACAPSSNSSRKQCKRRNRSSSRSLFQPWPHNVTDRTHSILRAIKSIRKFQQPCKWFRTRLTRFFRCPPQIRIAHVKRSSKNQPMARNIHSKAKSKSTQRTVMFIDTRQSHAGLIQSRHARVERLRVWPTVS